MANLKVSLVVYAKTEDGWKRYAAVIGKNGQIRPGFGLVDGKPQPFKKFTYQLRSYEGRRLVYQTLGRNAQDAAALQVVAERKRIARHQAKTAGVPVKEEEGRQLIRTAVDKYIQRAINKRSLVGAEVYRHSLAMFEESAKDIAYIDEVTEDTLLTYHAFLRKRGNSERTISNRHGHVKSLLLWSGVDQKIVGKGPKYDKKLVVVYSRDEMDTLFAACDDPYFLTVLKILQMAGLREAEATHLTWGEVDLKKRLIHVKSKPEYGFSLKDREERVVPLPPALVAALQERRKVVPKSKLVVGTDDDKPHTKWLRFLKRLAKAAGFNCGHCRTCRETDGEECQRWTLHSFRRRYATTLDERGVSLKQIMDFLGHSDIETTMKYLGNRGIKDSQPLIHGINWSGDPARDGGDVCPTCGQSVEVGRPRP